MLAPLGIAAQASASALVANSSSGSTSQVRRPLLWVGQVCQNIFDAQYGDSGTICEQLNGNDSTGDLQWQSLVTFYSHYGGMKRISLIQTGLYSPNGEATGDGFTAVNLGNNPTSAYISTQWFTPVPFLLPYYGFVEEPCIFWSNLGIGCASDMWTPMYYIP